MYPQEISKIQGSFGPLKAEEVCLRAVSYLKKVINESWKMPTDQEDKENQSNNGPQQFSSKISEQDK
jgi:hypothetical protein